MELTKREDEVLALLIQGLSNAEISEALYIEVFTVKVHVQKIFKKKGIHQRSKLIASELSKKNSGKINYRNNSTRLIHAK